MADPLFDKYSKYSAPRLIELGFPKEQVVLLSEVGLPTWCAPNMSFGEVFEIGRQLPVVMVQEKRYVGIGQDRDDNIIAVDLNEHVVWSLVKDSLPMFFAPNVLVLLRLLSEFQACVDAAVEIDSQCFVESRVQLKYFEAFVRWANSTDPLILEAGSFWASVLHWVGGPNQSFEADGYAAAQFQR